MTKTRQKLYLVFPHLDGFRPVLSSQGDPVKLLPRGAIVPGDFNFRLEAVEYEVIHKNNNFSEHDLEAVVIDVDRSPDNPSTETLADVLERLGETNKLDVLDRVLRFLTPLASRKTNFEEDPNFMDSLDLETAHKWGLEDAETLLARKIINMFPPK